VYDFDDNLKISVVGDIHLNLHQSFELNSWETSRFLELFNILAKDDSQIIVLNGDIFDRSKVTYEEISVFYQALKKIQHKRIFVIAGNHEEFSSSSTIFDFLPEVGMFTYVKHGILQFRDYSIRLVGHPYLKEICNATTKTDYLFSHYRSKIQFADEEVDNDCVSNTYRFVILSDIHYPYNPCDNIIYTSSPYSIHFEDTETTYGYLTFEYDGEHKVEFKQLDLPSKKKVIFDTADSDEVIPAVKKLDSKHRYNVVVQGYRNKTLEKLLSTYNHVAKISFVDSLEEIENAEDDTIIQSIVDGAVKDIFELIESLMDDKYKTKKHIEAGRSLLKGSI
jgi:DNA repair exonuclease SbcCD nuclease subunit